MSAEICKKIEKRFLTKGMRAAQSEIRRNFNKETDSESGNAWTMVLRGYPPPILDVTGELRAQALHSGNVVIMPHKAVLTIDPKDSTGRGYAVYHQDGVNVHQRRFVTQSAKLTTDQTNILLNEIDREFK